MKTFPATDSTLSATHVGQFIQQQYGLSAQTHCRIFRTGINHTYMVVDQSQRFVFRIYSHNWRTEQEIREELRLINLLKEAGVSVSYPVMDLDQRFIHKLPAPEGLRYAVLFSYAPGKKVRNFSEGTSYDLGILMAKMHRTAKDVQLRRIDYNASSLIADSYQLALRHFPEANEEMQFVMKAGRHVTGVFSGANTGELRKGAVHLDIWYDNMQINDLSGMTIFDFDFCGNGWLLHDVAYFIMQLYHVEPDKKEYELKKAAFFSGYESTTALSEEEKRMLPYSGLSIWLFYLGVQSQRFDNWSNIFLSENYLKRYIGMVKEWLQYNKVELNEPL